MTDAEARAKADLVEYLDAARDAVLWKLDGLSESALRRPMTPTGTNLLGVLGTSPHDPGPEATLDPVDDGHPPVLEPI